MFLYLITNTIDGKKYIGQTKASLHGRWMSHCKNKSVTNVLANAIRKHGRENFTIESLLKTDDHDLLNEFEKEYIIRYCTRKPNGYNILPGGATTAKWKMPKDFRIRAAAAAFGKKHSKEWNENIRLGLLASGQSEKARLFHTGKVVSPETRKRISDAKKATRGQPGSFGKGEDCTPEMRQRSREMAAINLRKTPEMRKKISEGLKRAWIIRKASKNESQGSD